MDFHHISVLLNECIEGLNIKPDGIYVDGTLGGAGHGSQVCARLNENGTFIGIDQDINAINAASKVLENCKNKVILQHRNFSSIKEILQDLNIEGVNGILLDLGVSSYQLDNEERGFSYRFDAPLDMRMDRTKNLTARDIINTYSQKELEQIFFSYGEEPFSKQVAKNIVLAREEKPIETTFELVDIIKKSMPEKVLRSKGHPAKRIFQAIRIEVNGELKDLEQTIFDMIEKLNSGGRIAIITFHSLEDRIVKNAFKLCATDCICSKEIPVCVCGHKATIKLVNKKPIEASQEEQILNPRSSCAKLRIAEKI